MFEDELLTSPKTASTHLTPRQLENQKDFRVVIEGDEKGPFDPTQLSVYCPSTRQIYGSGKIFKSTFKELHRLKAKVLLVIPHTPEAINYGVELNDISFPKSEAIAPQVAQRHLMSWLYVNFDSDPEMQRMRKEMEEAGLLEIIDWDACVARFKPELDAVLDELTRPGVEKDSVDHAAESNAKIFFQTAHQKHFTTNPMFQAACLQGDAPVTEYQHYSLAEVHMGKAWKRAGITQVLYPKTFYQDNLGKNPHDGIDLFDCINSGEGDIRCLNIKITPDAPHYVPYPQRRKNSADAKITKEQEFILQLKEQKRNLQSKVGNLATHLDRLKAQVQKEKADCIWSHSSDVEVLTKTALEADEKAREADKKAKEAEEEAMRSFSLAQTLTADLCDMRSEVKTANTVIDELKGSNRALESHLDELASEIKHREEELEMYKKIVTEIHKARDKMHEQAAQLEAKEKEHAAKEAALLLREDAVKTQEAALNEKTLAQETTAKEQAEKAAELLRREEELCRRENVLQAKETEVNHTAYYQQLRRTHLHHQDITLQIREKALQQHTEEAHLSQELQQHDEASQKNRRRSKSFRTSSRASSAGSACSTSASPGEHSQRTGLSETFLNIFQRFSRASSRLSTSPEDIHRSRSTSPSLNEDGLSPRADEQSVVFSPMPHINHLPGISNLLGKGLGTPATASKETNEQRERISAVTASKRNHLSAPELTTSSINKKVM